MIKSKRYIHAGKEKKGIELESEQKEKRAKKRKNIDRAYICKAESI